MQPTRSGLRSSGGNYLRSVALLAGALNACGVNDDKQGDVHTVALLQSPKQQATELTEADVAELVSSAVAQAGGFDFIRDGQTVVLKPNLVTFYQDNGDTTASVTVNGIATDWRVVKAVADLVRAKNPNGQILVMEGSRVLTVAVFPVLGYTPENFGTSVDEFVAIEGSSCSDRSTGDLVSVVAPSGKSYWLHQRYLNADVVISIPTMATDAASGIGGAVQNLGIGATPAGQYSSNPSTIDCTRTMIDSSTPELISEFIRDYYSIRPADFVVMDGLQGLEHGPLPSWDDSGVYAYQASVKNMRLILAGRNAVAVDSVQSLVMKCDPNKVPYLTKLTADGLGATDLPNIEVVGKQVSEVATPFASKQIAICPGL